MKPDLYIGIDPDVDKSGYCRLCCEFGKVETGCFDMYDICQRIEAEKDNANACEKLLILRKENYKRQESEFKQTDYPYISKNLDYRENIVNKKAEQFYKRHKVEEIEYSVEKTNQTNNIVLMRTKNCIRFALGQCLTRDKQSSDFDQNLYLKDNHQTYKLTFDCKNCIMEVDFFSK